MLECAGVHTFWLYWSLKTKLAILEKILPIAAVSLLFELIQFVFGIGAYITD